MNSTNKKPPGAQGSPQQFKRPTSPAQQFKPGVAQSKNAAAPPNVRQPVAPPVYRPQQAKPPVVQQKTANPLQMRTQPVAPPVYRPQPLPKVLQTKKPVSPQSGNQSKQTPAAPPAQRPQPASKVLQPRMPNPLAALPAHRHANAAPHGMTRAATIQLAKYRRTAQNTTTFVEIDELNGTYKAKGWKQTGEQRVNITGSLETKADPNDNKRRVIGNIKSTPKRTGVGTLLIYEFVQDAIKAGITTVGTDLSALEAGTPEFYKSLGLAPTPQQSQNVLGLIRGGLNLTQGQIDNMLYAGRLDNSPQVVLNNIQNAVTRWQTDMDDQRI